MHQHLHTDDGLDGGTPEQLGISLAKASPEVKKCVASCKHIAETARQQSNFQNVRSTFLFVHLIFKMHDWESLNNSGEWRVVPGRPGDWQGLLYRHGICVFYRHNRGLPDGAFQPATLRAFPQGCQDVSATDKCPGVKQDKISKWTFPSKKLQIWWCLGANSPPSKRLRDDEDTVGVFSFANGVLRTLQVIHSAGVWSLTVRKGVSGDWIWGWACFSFHKMSCYGWHLMTSINGEHDFKTPPSHDFCFDASWNFPLLMLAILLFKTQLLHMCMCQSHLSPRYSGSRTLITWLSGNKGQIRLGEDEKHLKDLSGSHMWIKYW